MSWVFFFVLAIKALVWDNAETLMFYISMVKKYDLFFQENIQKRGIL